MNHPKITATLSVTVQGASVLAKVSFRNTGADPAYLYKVNACLNGTIENKVFVVTRGGAKVAYTGVLAKRRITPEDFARLQPGEERTVEVALDRAYDLKSGSGPATARYEAFHGSPDDPAALWLIQSNDATFTPPA